MTRRKFFYVAILLACGLCYTLLGGQGGCESCTDNDGDGFAIEGGSCGLVDCDDTNPAVNPDAKEGPAGNSTCSDGLDNDCDGLIDSSDQDCGSAQSLWGEMTWGQDTWGE